MYMKWDDLDKDSRYLLRINGELQTLAVEASEEEGAAIIYDWDRNHEYQHMHRLVYEEPITRRPLLLDDRGMTRLVPVWGKVEVLYVHDQVRGVQ